MAERYQKEIKGLFVPTGAVNPRLKKASKQRQTAALTVRFQQEASTKA